MSYIGLHRVKRENIIYVLDYTSCQFWILRFCWICHAILFTIIWFYFHVSFTQPFRDESVSLSDQLLASSGGCVQCHTLPRRSSPAQKIGLCGSLLQSADASHPFKQTCSRDTRISHVVLLFRVSFVSVVENVCLQKKLHLIKQRPEENTTAYILWFLSEAKLAYPTAWTMGEEGKVVSFLKWFTDRAFAGHLLRTVGYKLILSDQQQRWPCKRKFDGKKSSRWGKKNPWRWVRHRQTRIRQMDFCPFWKPCRDTWVNYRPAWIIRRTAQLPAPRWVNTLEQTRDAQRTVNLNSNHCANKELTGTADQSICACCKRVGHFANISLYQARKRRASRGH